MTAFRLSPELAPAPDANLPTDHLAKARARAAASLHQRERRESPRLPLLLDGRFLDHLGQEHGLRTLDLSCDGAHIEARARPPVETAVVCYVDSLGRIAARVARHTEPGFAVAFTLTRHKRDKIADRIIWLYNKDRLGLEEERAAPRFDAGGPAIVQLGDGSHLQCRVLDISLTGAAFESAGRVPLVGETIIAGNLRGEVVRAQAGQFAIRYIR